MTYVGTYETTLNGEQARFGPVYENRGIAIMPFAFGIGVTLRIANYLLSSYPTQEQFDSAVAFVIDANKEDTTDDT